MRALNLVVDGLAYIVQQTGALGKRYVRAYFGSHNARKMGNLDGVLQHVLAVAGAVFKSAQQLNKFVMQPVYAAFENGLLARFADLLIHFLARLFNHFLYAARMNTPVHYQLFKRNPRNLPPDRVKARKYNGFRSIVDYQINACSGFKGAYVPAFAADDSALHFIVGQRNDADGGFGYVIRRAALYGKGYYVPCALVGLFLGLLLYFPEHKRRFVPRVVLNAFKQNILGFVHAHAGYGFQLFKLPGLQLVYLRLARFNLLLLLYGVFLALLDSLYLFVQQLFLLQKPALAALYFVTAFPVFAFVFALELINFFFCFQYRFFFDGFRALLCGVYHLFYGVFSLGNLSLGNVTAIPVPSEPAAGTANNPNYNGDKYVPQSKYTSKYISKNPSISTLYV